MGKLVTTEDMMMRLGERKAYRAVLLKVRAMMKQYPKRDYDDNLVYYALRQLEKHFLPRAKAKGGL